MLAMGWETVGAREDGFGSPCHHPLSRWLGVLFAYRVFQVG